jgi:hypothetical protein
VDGHPTVMATLQTVYRQLLDILYFNGNLGLQIL